MQAIATGETAQWLNSLALDLWRMGGKEMLEVGVARHIFSNGARTLNLSVSPPNQSMIQESLNDVLSWYKLPGMVSDGKPLKPNSTEIMLLMRAHLRHPCRKR